MAACGVPPPAAAEYLPLLEHLGVDSPQALLMALTDPGFQRLGDALEAGAEVDGERRAVRLGHLLLMKARLPAALAAGAAAP
jgi:hypothetical protein